MHFATPKLRPCSIRKGLHAALKMNGNDIEKRWFLRWQWVAAGLLLMVAGAIALALGWSERFVLLEYADMLRVEVVYWLQTVPLPVYLLVFALGPVVGMPLTIFYLTVGATVGNLPLALLLAWICINANMLISYGVTRSFLHPVIERLIRHKGFSVPQISQTNEWKWIVGMRASPVPWVFQNYLLSLGGVRLWPYLWMSFLIQGTVGSGMIMVGESLFAGRARFAFIGIFVIILASCGFSILRRRAERTKRHASDAAR